MEAEMPKQECISDIIGWIGILLKYNELFTASCNAQWPSAYGKAYQAQGQVK